MKILVTGSTGFVGVHLVGKLITLGYNCRCLVRDRAKAECHWGENVELVDEGLASLDSALECLQGCTHAVYLSDWPPVWGEAPAQHKGANVKCVRNVVAACEAEQVELLVYCSAANAAGFSIHAASEGGAAFQPQVPGEACDLEAEGVVLSAAKQRRISAIVARTHSVYGPEDLRRVPLYSAIEKGRFFLVGKGDVLIRPTYIEDVVDGLIACLNHPEYAGQVFDIAGPDSITLKEFVNSVQKALGVEARTVDIPCIAAYGGAIVCEGVEVLTEKDPILPRYRATFLNVGHTPLEKAGALHEFHAQTCLSAGMARTVSWFRALRESGAAQEKHNVVDSIRRENAGGEGSHI